MSNMLISRPEFFEDRSSLLADNPVQRNEGIAVVDVDNDGRFDAFIAGRILTSTLL